MKILYIPFTLEDAIGDLSPKADKWSQEYQNRDKDTVIVLHEGLTQEKKNKIEKALENGDCQIYVLGHGVEAPELVVSNQEKQDEYTKEISIEEVAKRFQQDLLTNIKFSDNNVVKLYFCDEFGQGKSHQMAEAFRQSVGEAYQSLDVKYYTDVSVTLPSKGLGDEFSSKKGMRSIGMANPLFCFKLSTVVGTAKSFRQELNETNNPLTIFSGAKNQHPKITYPEYSHPLIKQLAEGLVAAIQSDHVLSRQQDRIIKDLLPNLPNQLSDYLVDSLDIMVNTTLLEMKINKPLLQQYLGLKGITDINPPVKRITDSQVDEISPSEWIDPEDFFGAELEFTPLDCSTDFLSLDDFNDVQSAYDNTSLSKRVL